MAKDSSADIAADSGRPYVDRAFEQLYQELHAMAHDQLRRGSGPPTLNTTVLVHETYLRLAGAGAASITDGRHLLAYASNVMRSVVVDMVRARRAGKRGAGAKPVTLSTGIVDEGCGTEEDVLKIHEALLELSVIDSVLVAVVEMRYFAGLSEEEIGAAMQISTRTVRRHWHKARLFLRETLKPG